MYWEKQGLIYCPNAEHEWEVDTFMTPHAMLQDENTIRIYGGVRDAEGHSRIKYIDVDAQDPSKVLYVADHPVLDLGEDGCFDDSGVILGDIIPVGDKLYMYYVAFQHVEKAKFYAFSGLAISEDGGDTFTRYSQVPIMDRTDKGKFGRCIHTVLHEDGVFKIYYALIHSWKFIDGKPYPSYNIWYTESKDGINIPRRDEHLCVDVAENEYRIGRPKVYRVADGYKMYYTRDFIPKDYRVGTAISPDGKNWTRQNDVTEIDKSESGWDSEMACYPVLLTVGNTQYMFYNGNDMGRSGVGYAVRR